MYVSLTLSTYCYPFSSFTVCFIGRYFKKWKLIYSVKKTFLLLRIHQTILIHRYDQQGLPFQNLGFIAYPRNERSGFKSKSKKLLINRNFFLLFFKLYVWQTECIFGMSSRPSFTICLWVKVSGARMSLYVRLWKVEAIYSFIIYFLCSETPFKQACKLISRAAWVKRYM